MYQILLYLSIFTASLAIIIDTPNGKIQGITNTTLSSTVYHSFLSVRYALAPTGKLRFKDPQPIVPWTNVYDATYEKNICYQIATNSDRESEDCLFLNIFTPKDLTDSSFQSNLSVMVWIHGGGFVSGSGYISSGFGPKFFMDANVILVTFNYRLGVFGFLSSGDAVIPGNFGLKDQTMALKWLQDNIKYFGGDPKKVTIFGQSSGGSSVGYHLLSRLSKDLFRAAILQSGSALSPMAFQRNETNYTYKTVKLIDSNFNYSNSSQLLLFLQNLSATDLDVAAFNVTKTMESPANYQISKGFFYAPVKEVCHERAFLTKAQFGLFERGNYNKVPVIIGNTNEESLALAKLGDLSFLGDAYDANPSILVPFDMHLNNESLKGEIGREILNYFSQSEGFLNDSAKLIRYHSVHDLDKGNVKQAELMALHSPVYFYQFAYSGKMGNNPYKIPGTENVMHSEDLNYLFSKWYSDDIPDNSDLSRFNITDQLVHFRIMSMWTNFAKLLNPTPLDIDTDLLENITWKPLEGNTFQYLEINKDLVMKSGYPKSGPYEFWIDLYNKYAVHPLDTF
ncbi:hypothetical protein ABEB36_005802 [Hypothenemus hampei]|uniref:Carboxylic ester hydrolase n=1 Tax=Hypothenemus hampei TaxID=57062 RepID=A0ABD1F045_HYPHA